MLCALIMAGGKGERFWPLSTERKPKQFLNLFGEGTMIQMTVRRLEKLIPLERIFIVTAKDYVDLVKINLSKLPERNIIVEPVGKNTAPCIGLSAFVIDKYYKDSTIAVLPSDHLIKEEEKFRATLQSAYEFVNKQEDSIVTLGMKPNRPETGYGYIKFDEICKEINKHEIRKVDEFVEKPDLDTAKKYLSEGKFLWNCGMFIWKTKTILKLTEKYLNKTYQVLSEIATTDDREFNNALEEKYKYVDSISVDYGIMEKAKDIYVIPSDFGWDDVGSWGALDRLNQHDDCGNVTSGQIIKCNTNNCIIKGNGKIIATVGINDLIIVDEADILLICSKEESHNIKKVLQEFKKEFS